MSDFSNFKRNGVSPTLYAQVEDKINLIQLLNKKEDVLTFQKYFEMLKNENSEKK